MLPRGLSNIDAKQLITATSLHQWNNILNSGAFVKSDWYSVSGIDQEELNMHGLGFSPGRLLDKGGCLGAVQPLPQFFLMVGQI